jgi:hypothetical protein
MGLTAQSKNFFISAVENASLASIAPKSWGGE